MTNLANIVWTIDPVHSVVQFKVKHLAISNVTGNFNIFNGNFQAENEDFNGANVHFEIDTNSVNTNNGERDNHLKSDAFFDSERFPKILFDGTLQESEDNFELIGELTILKTTRAIKLIAEHTGTGQGRFGDTRAGFEISGKLNRKDYGLNFGLLTDTGNLIVGEEIKIHFDIQVIKQPL